VILGMTQIMSQASDVSQTHQEHLESILRSGNHLLLLVNRLIETSKFKAKRPFSAEQAFDFMRLLDDVHAFERQQAMEETEPEQAGEQTILTASALANLPEELREILQAAVEEANFEATTAIIERIRQHDERLAETLAALVRNYRFDILQALFEENTQNATSTKTTKEERP
jgi:signal transduction histidine kinase